MMEIVLAKQDGTEFASNVHNTRPDGIEVEERTLA
jgi:hypothetical protein